MSELGQSGMPGDKNNPPDFDMAYTDNPYGDKHKPSEPNIDQAPEGTGIVRNKLINNEYGLLLVKAGRLLSMLFLAVVSLFFFLIEKTADAVIVLSCLLIIYLFISAADGGRGTPLWQERKTARRLSFNTLTGSPHTNAMFIPLKLRYAPFAIALICGICMLIIGIVKDKSAVDIVLEVTNALSPSILLGLSGIMSLAAGNAITHLKQHDIEILSPEKLGAIAKCDMLLADKTLFSSYKSAEISGVYINDAFCGLSELDFESHKPLVIGFKLCNDGSLTKTYGFKQKISDSILRAMRASPIEQREVSKYKLTRHIPFDDKTGIVSAECCTPYGNIISFTAGKPESMFKYIKYIQSDTETREISPQELKRLRIKLRQNYLTGKLAIALALGIPGESALTFLSFVFISVPIVEDAQKAISDLRENGTEIMLVTDENEASSYYRATMLNITTDMSQVLNGHRIDNFRSENLIRASLHSHLAAEANQNHRLILGQILHKRKHVLAAASDNPSDTLLENADIRLTSEKDGIYPADVCARSFKVTGVSTLIRTAKAVCSLCKRACCHMLFAPLCLSLFLLLCVVFTGSLPFPSAIIIPTVLLIPLPQAILTSCADYGSAKLIYKGLFPTFRDEKQPPIKVPGYGFEAWWLFSALFISLLVFFTFISSFGDAGQKTPAAAGAAYLSVFLAVMLNGLISYVWGKSVFSVLEQGGRKILAATIIISCIVLALLRLPAFNAFLGFEPVPYRQIPSAALPSVILLLIYEIITFIRKNYEKRKERLSPRNGM